MVCYHPLTAFRASVVNPSGRRSLVFDRNKALSPAPVIIPCGQCVGCRLERSRVWAVRCVNEASLHEYNCFISLTYDDLHLPENRSLNKSDFQKFMKRFRKSLDVNIRYYYCGEYGEQFGRPHYHALIFGFDFSDKIFWRINNNGDRCYRSPTLERLWPFGLSEIGDVTFQSAAYVARYIMKKRLGKDADEYYAGRLPEFTDMSRRPGIGSDWFKLFYNDVYPHDFMVMNGKKFRVPRFYDNRFELAFPDELSNIKDKRKRSSRLYRSNNTKLRLLIRERLALIRSQRLERKL